MTLFGPRVKAGIALNSSTKHTSGTSSDGGTDIVFAYQLMEIDYRFDKRSLGTSLKKTKQFIKGTYMARDKVGQGEISQVNEEEDNDDFVELERVVEYAAGKEGKEIFAAAAYFQISQIRGLDGGLMFVDKFAKGRYKFDESRIDHVSQ